MLGALNNGNWQWTASTGCDPQPYFRVFNPWRQQRKFDSDAVYIKRWVPELASLSAADIHSLETPANPKHPAESPVPTVDHGESSDRVTSWLRKLSASPSDTTARYKESEAGGYARPTHTRIVGRARMPAHADAVAA
jgi:hypothetical protein